ncbi:hypothetical protein K7W42_15685 [Deinococcus sp. HMF7604]|uniref:hypothetical protein n=1 Tax=Deinococcus betulae TaxID=2873312 RepID=UPI001CCD6736|nr:hypothetical protein [Deinococcus betulae]MBZ9752294.1 hypothetical protein [Deinococcus betulae]
MYERDVPCTSAVASTAAFASLALPSHWDGRRTVTVTLAPDDQFCATVAPDAVWHALYLHATDTPLGLSTKQNS